MVATDTQGYVYVLVSPNCDSLKIGGSDYPPFKRLKEINHSEPYKHWGKWELADFRQVRNWRKVKRSLHYAFRSRLNTRLPHQKELFRISLKEASDAFHAVDEDEIIGKPKVDRMFYDAPFRDYLQQLFVFAGLTHWLAYQGAWTFVLFPATEEGVILR
uniref:GIY-YIG nuclease family protein n=1 Tax=Conchiformibius kuhniae TaxID=211502 RepID=A0A8T9MZ22_9NEIS|nr:GIY-YIG nuclease family protein [Conchiformibius kuhniae]